MKLASAAAAALAALALAAAAAAHVDVTPSLAEPGSSQTFVFTVPNDEGTTPVVRFELSLPPGTTLAAAEAKPGWTTAARDRSIAWSGGRIPPGRFTAFAVRAAVPQREGTISFDAHETFADGPGPTFRVSVVVASVRAATATARAAGRDEGARTLGKAALAVAIAAAVIALAAAFAALWRWLRGA